MAKLTEAFIKALEVPEGKSDVLVFDDALPGFGVRKYTSGATFYVVKYNVGKRQRKRFLGRVVAGSLPEQRKLANTILTKARLGIDHFAEVDAAKAAAADPDESIGDLVDDYLRDREGHLRPSTHSETTRYLRRYWKPLHPLEPKHVTRAAVVAELDKIEKAHGKVAADRARNALTGFYAWLIDRAKCDTNPALSIRARAPRPKETDALTIAELVAIWIAAGDDDFGKIVRLLILTGQRKREIAYLDEVEINEAEKQIELPGRRTKNKGPHVCPLSSEAWEVIKSQTRVEGRTKLFGEGEVGFSGFSKSKLRVIERLPREFRHWRIHDLRTAVSTHLNALKFAQPHVVELILNHQSGHKAGVAGTYNKAEMLPERRKALKKWGAYMAKMVAAEMARRSAEMPMQ